MLTQYDRRKEIIEILYNRKHETMSNLAFELGVSRQTIYNDIAALSIDHPEIDIRSGRYGGGIFIDYGRCPSKKYLTRNEIIFLQKICKMVRLTDDDNKIMNNIIHKLSITA